MAIRALVFALASALLLGGAALPGPAAAADQPALQPPGGSLPVPVARTRDAMVKLALANRYEELEALAKRGGPGFTYNFGFEKRKPAAYWRAEAALGRNPLPKLAAVLRQPPVLEDGVYLWPAAAAANPSPADWEALKAVYPAARVARYRTEGYTGWRAGVDLHGNWKFFVHGD